MFYLLLAFLSSLLYYFSTKRDASGHGCKVLIVTVFAKVKFVGSGLLEVTTLAIP